MTTLYNIIVGVLIAAGLAFFLYVLSKVQMKGWLKALEEHFNEKITKIKKDDYDNKEKNE